MVGSWHMDGRGGRAWDSGTMFFFFFEQKLRACWGWWRSHGLSPGGLLVGSPGTGLPSEFLKLFTESGIRGVNHD